jgi:hypothetical protein
MSLILIVLLVVIVLLFIIINKIIQEQFALARDLYQSTVKNKQELYHFLQPGDVIFEWSYEHLTENHNLLWRWLSSYYMHGSYVVWDEIKNEKAIIEYVPFKKHDAEKSIDSSTWGTALISPLKDQIKIWSALHTQFKVYRPLPSGNVKFENPMKINRKKAFDICKLNLYPGFNCCAFLASYVWGCECKTWVDFIQQSPGCIQKRLELNSSNYSLHHIMCKHEQKK